MSFTYTGSASWDGINSNVILTNTANSVGEAVLGLIPTDNALVRFWVYKSSNNATPPQFLKYSWGDGTDRLNLTFNDNTAQLHLNSTLIVQCNFSLPYNSNNSVAVRTRLDTTKIYVNNALLISTPTSNLNFQGGDYRFQGSNVGSNLVYVKYPSVQPIYTINTATEVVGSLKCDYLNAPVIASSNVSSCNISTLNALAVWSSNNFANFMPSPLSNNYLPLVGGTMTGSLLMSNANRVQLAGNGTDSRLELFQTNGNAYIDFWSNLIIRTGSNTNTMTNALTISSNAELITTGKIYEEGSNLAVRYAPSNISTAVAYGSNTSAFSSNALSNYSLTTHNHDGVYRKTSDNVPWSQVSGAPNWSSDSNGDALSIAGIVLGSAGLAFGATQLFNADGLLSGVLTGVGNKVQIDPSTGYGKLKEIEFVDDLGAIQAAVDEVGNLSAKTANFIGKVQASRVEAVSCAFGAGTIHLSNDQIFFNSNTTSNMTLSSNMLLVQNGQDFTFSNTSSTATWIVNERLLVKNNSGASNLAKFYIGTTSSMYMMENWGLNCVGNGTTNHFAVSNASMCVGYRPINSNMGVGHLLVMSNVGIGTTSPTQKLHIVGNVTCSSNITTSNLTLPLITASNLQFNVNYFTEYTSSNSNIELKSSQMAPNSAGGAGGSNLYGRSMILANGGVSGVYWGSNPSVYGGDMVIQAGNVQLAGNNGSAYVQGFGGNCRHYAGYAYVSSTHPTNRLVESGRHQFYTAKTNGTFIGSNDYNLALEINNLGNLVAFSNALLPYIACSNASFSNISACSNITSTGALSNVAVSTTTMLSTTLTGSNLASSNINSINLNSSNMTTQDLTIGTCRIVQGALSIADYSQFASQYSEDIFAF